MDWSTKKNTSYLMNEGYEKQKNLSFQFYFILFNFKYLLVIKLSARNRLSKADEPKI